MKALIPFPRCKTCGRTCKRRWQKKGKPQQYCSQDCVPSSARLEGARIAHQRLDAANRLRRFGVYLKRLQSLDKITGADLMAVFAEIEEATYQRGYQACQSKWLKRPRRRTSPARKAA